MHRYFCGFIAILCLLPTIGLAIPESTAPVSVTEIRPYVNGTIFVTVDSVELCNTYTFRIDFAATGKNSMYAAVLTALATGKKVRLEVHTGTGCQGWGTALQSVYLQAN